jgi:polysaccharide export outer membrane protein
VVLLSLGPLTLLLSAQPASSQDKNSETPQHSPEATQPLPQTSTTQATNEKIQQLAALSRTQATDAPIGPGDLIHVDIFDVPELSRDFRVSDTGEISFPLVRDRVAVAGLTPFELEPKFENLLITNGLVSHPNVSVNVRERTSAPISVVGAVAHTMVYQVTRPTTLLEVMAAAGGVADTAGDTVIITRPAIEASAVTNPGSDTTTDEPQEQKIIIRLRDLLESGDSVYDIPVHGGDMITVPPAGIVYVLGFGIEQPGGYVLSGHGEQVTVLQMIALARGFARFSKPNDAAILRDNPTTGKRDTIPVRIMDIQKHKLDDVPLQSNDILYVPDNGGKKALAQGIQSAVAVGTSIAIYHAY